MADLVGGGVMEGFDWEKFKNGAIAVNCTTQEKADGFLALCDLRGLVWASKASTVSESYWHLHKRATYYRVSCVKGILVFGKLVDYEIEHSCYRGKPLVEWEEQM